MSSVKSKTSEAKEGRIRLTVQLTETAYDAIHEVQRLHRKKTKRALPIWRILDTAVIDYARKLGVRAGD